MTGSFTSGIDTIRLPALDFGGPKAKPPPAHLGELTSQAYGAASQVDIATAQRA